MPIIYLSSVCARKRFEQLVTAGIITSQFQNQKFHNLLLTGLRAVTEEEIVVISFYPADRVGKRWRSYDEEIEDGIRYVYPNFFDAPVIHHIAKFVGTYLCLCKTFRRGAVIVCNIMNFDECKAALFFRLFHKVKVCSVVADVPGITSGARMSRDAKWKRVLAKWAAPYNNASNNKYDGYLFLTEEMDKVVNTKHKPYVVVEGIADSKMTGVNNLLSNKNAHKTILYAGGLHREYGIQILVEAFRKIKNPDVELHIYGKGNYVSDLEKIVSEDSRIKYFGTKSNSEIVAEQIRAHILINPRPTKEEFVKYSFPSKIIECMASGTPLLTTKLPGIPKDYYPYIYCINDETVEGVYESMIEILNKPAEVLHQKGMEAKAFIISKKNPLVQGEKLKRLIDTVIS